ncbi:MAG: 50S ribosomal protein L24 [Oscillospiraceae bacterium]|jgi:large subunit ribosomal protein L24|nr:50S ribosomal protein L24 [Oscillospiraceae bacterium]
MNKVHVKKGDQVMVINGKYRGKKGKVLEVSPKEGKVIVEGINIITKHVKPRKMGEAGGLIKAESALYADKVQLICPKCGKATRVGRALDKKGNKVRTCKKSDCLAQFE